MIQYKITEDTTEGRKDGRKTEGRERRMQGGGFSDVTQGKFS